MPIAVEAVSLEKYLAPFGDLPRGGEPPGLAWLNEQA
jgi:hypothetical protein